MNNLEVLGLIGSVIILTSMSIPSTHRRQNICMRSINIIGSIIMATYSWMLKSYSNCFLNVAISCINIFYIIKLYVSLKEEDKI